jgi:hypothetical protein
MVLFASAASAQSLAEVARLEAERRTTIASPAKVYTNENLRADPRRSAPAPVSQPPVAGQAPAGAPVPAVVPASPSGVPQENAGATEPPEAARDEAYWRARLAAERDGLARAQTFAEALQSRINALTTDFAARSDPAQRAVIGADRQAALAELDRVRQEIGQHKKVIATVQGEARRAGVPAGWVR